MHNHAHPSTVNEAAAAASSYDADLIREFCFQVDVSDITKLKYATQLEEFRVWLSHPRTRRIGGPGTLADAEQADVVRFMSYLMAGERYAAPSHACLKGALAASTRKSSLASLRALYRSFLASETLSKTTDYDPRTTHTPDTAQHRLAICPPTAQATIQATVSPDEWTMVSQQVRLSLHSYHDPCNFSAIDDNR